MIRALWRDARPGSRAPAIYRASARCVIAAGVFLIADGIVITLAGVGVLH